MQIRLPSDGVRLQTLQSPLTQARKDERLSAHCPVCEVDDDESPVSGSREEQSVADAAANTGMG